MEKCMGQFDVRWSAVSWENDGAKHSSEVPTRRMDFNNGAPPSNKILIPDIWEPEDK